MRVWPQFGRFFKKVSVITKYPLYSMSAIDRFDCIVNWLLEKAERGICWLLDVQVVHKFNVYPTGCIFQMCPIFYVFCMYYCQDIFSSSVNFSFFAIAQICTRDQYLRVHVLHTRWYCNACQPESVHKLFRWIFIHKACVRRQATNVYKHGV